MNDKLTGEEPTAEDAMASAVRLLARREHSRNELRLKLLKREFSHDLIDNALNACAENGYQSDDRFAEQFVRSRLDRAQGPLKIRAELARRGVAGSLIDEALADCGGDWFAMAAEARCKRFGSVEPKSARERARQQRFLASRGFSGEHARYALDNIELENIDLENLI